MSSPEKKSIDISRLAPVLLVGIFVIFPLTVFGADAPPEQTPPFERIETIDAPRDYLSEKFVTFVSEIDRFFGDDRNYQENNQSVIQLDITRVTGYSGDRKIVLAGRAKVNLPSTEKRFHLVLESNPDQNLTGESTPTKITPPVNKVVKPESYGAGLRFEKAREGQWHFSTDAGLKFRSFKVDPFTRARGSYEVQLDQWRLKVAETIFWFQTSGAGENTQLDVERFLSDPVLFRATSNVTWLKDTTNLDLRQDLSIYHTLNERSALLYQASAIGVSRPSYHATDYVLLMTYRYRLHRKWIFFELSPQMHYPEVMDYHYSPMLSMRLELLLDESK
jgi:hypothetical protein